MTHFPFAFCKKSCVLSTFDCNGYEIFIEDKEKIYMKDKDKKARVEPIMCENMTQT